MKSCRDFAVGFGKPPALGGDRKPHVLIIEGPAVLD